MLCDGPGFVGLEVADEVPYQFVIGNSRNLFNALSDLVFAEISLSGGGSLDDARKRLFLADGEQLH